MPQIAILGGSPAHLKILNDVYQTLQACSNRVIMAVPQNIANLVGSEAELILPASHKGRADDSHITERLTDANLIILSPGLSLTSEWHLRLDKIVNEVSRPLLITEESVDLIATSPELLGDGRSLLILSTEQALRLAGRYALPVKIRPSRGIFNKIELIDTLSSHTNAMVVLLDANTLVLGHFTLDTIGLLQSENKDLLALRGEVSALLGSFVTQQPTIKKQFEGLMTATYVLYQAIEDQSQSLNQSIRQILNKVV